MQLMEDNPELKDIIHGKEFKTKGGIIADEVGLGKTALVIGIIVSHPAEWKWPLFLKHEHVEKTMAMRIACEEFPVTFLSFCTMCL